MPDVDKWAAFFDEKAVAEFTEFVKSNPSYNELQTHLNSIPKTYLPALVLVMCDFIGGCFFTEHGAEKFGSSVARLLKGEK